ncbi:hypothetical protein M0Q50_07785 [bacterium]|jgi:hypothetical protein|nr:hypothetical protein [bacterium]
MNYIGISGAEGSGKDAVCKYLQRILQEHWSIIKFVDGVKKLLNDTYPDEWNTILWETGDRIYREGIMPSFNMTRREVIRFVAEDKKTNNKDIWVNDLFEHKNSNLSGNYLISDVRFINEIDAIRKHNGIIIRIELPIDNKNTEHISERELDNYKKYDEIILNDKTLKDLFNKIDIIIKKYKIK